MSNNLLALKTLNYIYSHPNAQEKKIQSTVKFCAWQIYKRLTNNHLDINLLPQVKLRCYPNSYSASAALYCGLYDYDEMNFLLRYLRSEDLFIDVGANIGIYSLLACSIIDRGQVYSFEALSTNYQRLQENIELNNFTQAKLFSLAISDRSGNISFNVTGNDSTAFIGEDSQANTIVVPTDTLDNIAKNIEIDNLTLVKMDIEGAELLALKGARSLLQQQRPEVWILEINDTVEHFGHTKKDIIDFLQSYNYDLYHYDAKKNQISLVDWSKHQGNNVLAIANSALDFVRDRIQ